jgi:outer membrane protein OmpA-like peptidoglycan-associated protein
VSPETPTPDPSVRRRLALAALSVWALSACAGKPVGSQGMAGAAAQLGAPAVPVRAWSEAMEQRRARLSDSLSSAGVEVLRTPDNVLVLRWAADRAFAGPTATPSEAAAAVWDRVAAALGTGPAWRARVQGHSDASTTDNEAAAALAALRALRLRDALVQRGLPVAAIEVEAWGARAPVLTNDTPEGRAGNRRVEIWLTD